MVRRISQIVASAALTALFFLTPGCGSETSTPAYKIGAVLPLSGSLGFLGEPERNALLLAAEDAKASGLNVELVIEDSRGDAVTGVSATNRLLAIGARIQIVSSTGVNRAVVPVLSAAGALTFAQCMDPTITSSSDLVFRLFPSYEAEQEITSRYMKEQGFHTVALLYANTAGILPEVEGFRRAAQASGLEIVRESSFEMSQTDLRTEILGIRRTDPDVLLILGYGGNYPVIVRQIKENGLQVPLVGNVALEQSAATEGGTALYEGIAFPSLSAAQDNPRVTEFRERYRTRYGSYPGGFFDYAYFYDAFLVSAQAITEAKGDIPTAKRILTERRFDGLSGAIDFSRSRDFFPPLAMARYVEGQVQRVTMTQVP